jgi:dihydroorotate dehydrogenase (NAD+) catalytic subunit
MGADLRLSVAGVSLKNPLICGAGEHVMDEAGIRAALDAGVAAVVAKSANESTAARRQLRTAEYALLDQAWRPLPWGDAPPGASLLNRSGLVDMPFDTWLELLARCDMHARTLDAHVVASLIPASLPTLPDLAAAVQAAGLRWLELNLSAPHASEAHAGILRPSDPDDVRAITATVREAVSLPLTVKLTAETADAVTLARAAIDGGADSVTLTGRHLAFLPDPRTRRPVLGTFAAIGGGWGLPLTLRWIAKTRIELGAHVALLGSNGARSGLDVVRFLLAGASAVQVTTVAATDGPSGLQRVLAELAEYMEGYGDSVESLVGQAADSVLTYEQVPGRGQ